MNASKPMYDFKMFLNAGGNDILMFRAWVVDEDTYYLQEVPNFKIHESYKNIFLSALNGELSIQEFEIENEQVNIHERSQVHHENIEGIFNAASSFIAQYYGLRTTFEQITLKNMVRFRYDGPELNIGYGLDPNIAGKIYHTSDELIKSIAVNNTNFQGIHQVSAQAGSTVIPYISETIDTEAIEILKKAMNDIKLSMVDRDFSNSDHRLSGLYKNFIKKLVKVKSIPGIKVFELIVGDDDTGIKLSDLSLISDANSRLYNRQISRVGKVHRPAFSLIGNPSIYSASVIIDGKEFSVHIKTDNVNFDHMIRILNENVEQLVEVEGYTKSEATIEAVNIRRHYIVENNE
ncbi:MAG TPA: hypothetical protein CFH81_02260 [Sulfurovum sp. UBA12169]|nr:MAG TPA: hypothetical protein CFH81_02260 [Sulfurovum sp. UBA12169]